MTLRATGSIALACVLVSTGGLVSPLRAADVKAIGDVTALIAEASTADEKQEHSIDGKSGDTAFPFIGTMKALASVGEVDLKTRSALTGYPDGHAAWLVDEDTIRVGYQSESYATMSNETYGWKMASGVRFTGSHIHIIDYDRHGFARFLENDMPASTIVKASGHLFSRVFNVFGNEVKPRVEGGKWGNQARADGTLVEFSNKYRLTNGDFFFQSFCGAHYEKANRYGRDIGFADDVWLTAEEWNIEKMFQDTEVDTNTTMGLASIVVDIANQTAYTAPALGQTGYEKLLPINPGHTDYVVIVLAGYNHDVNPAPLKIYVGKKGVDATGKPVVATSNASERDKFLARNGLLYGKIYGMALKNNNYAKLGIADINPTTKMMDAYLKNPDAPDNFEVTFFPTSYQWRGWANAVAVGDTEMMLWQKETEQPEGYTFFVGDTKTEHPAVDPDITTQRYIQNMTREGALIGITFTNLIDQLEVANGALPVSFSADVTRIIAAVDGALTLETGGKGIKHGGKGSAATDKNGQAKVTSPDGLQWIKTADADVLIVDEDSGNTFGERKFALVIDPDTLTLREPGKGYFLAMAGGKSNPRAINKVSSYGGTFSEPQFSEFSGTWNVSALVARKQDGKFYTMNELAGVGEQLINRNIAIGDSKLIGVVQHKSESEGAVAEVGADHGGQLFMFNLRLPPKAHF